MTIIIVAILSFIFGMMIMALLIVAHDCDQSVGLEESRAAAQAEFDAAKARITAYNLAYPPEPEEEDDPKLDIFPPYVEGQSKFFDK